jgi:hypothetical protein
MTKQKYGASLTSAERRAWNKETDAILKRRTATSKARLYRCPADGTVGVYKRCSSCSGPALPLSDRMAASYVKLGHAAFRCHFHGCKEAPAFHVVSMVDQADGTQRLQNSFLTCARKEHQFGNAVEGWQEPKELVTSRWAMVGFEGTTTVAPLGGR